MAEQEQVVQSVIQGLEKTIDQELDMMADIGQIRVARLKAMKKRQEDERRWKLNGHGEYSEIADEPSFFEAIKNSEKVVIHFYLKPTERCKIVDMHLKRIAPEFIGTKFIKIDAEKAPFLTERLKVKVIPTILGIVDKNVVDRLVGFTELGNTDDFTTADLKTRLAQNKVIEYDPENSPTTRRKMKIEMEGKKRRNLRDSDSDGDSDDEEQPPQLSQSIPVKNGAGAEEVTGFQLSEEEERALEALCLVTP